MRIISATLLIIFFSLAHAKQPKWQYAIGGSYKTSPYVDLLPPFCGLSKNPKYKNVNWKKVYGPEMTWSNHFCEALTIKPICRKYPVKDKKECLSRLESSYIYWQRHMSNPDFKLLPYYYVEYGDLLKEIGDTGKAITQYQNALKANPKYIKAYTRLVDYYIEIGLLEEAEHAVNTALKIKETKSLLRRKKEIEKITEASP